VAEILSDDLITKTFHAAAPLPASA